MRAMSMSWRFAEPQFHQRDQAVAAGQQLAGALGRPEFGQRVVERGCALYSNAVGITPGLPG